MEKREHILIEMAKQNLGAVRDNLYRAKCAAARRDVNAQWGNSGQTLAQLIAGYEVEERDALQAVAVAQKAFGGL